MTYFRSLCRLGTLVSLLGLSSLALGACSGESPETGSLSGDATALSVEQCHYELFADHHGKVPICHYKNGRRWSFVRTKVTPAECEQHVTEHFIGRPDYVAYGDNNCSGDGCLPLDAPCDATVPCCEGATCGPAGTCIEVDACATSATACGANQVCTDRPYPGDDEERSCACAAGYEAVPGTGDGHDGCDGDHDGDGDHGDHDSDSESDSESNADSYSDSDEGGDGGPDVPLACVDVDECALGTDDCAVDATCANTAGGFTCACNPGYSGDGVTCDDLDECAADLDDCAADAACTNTAGGFTCACNPGYGGDGVTCASVCGDGLMVAGEECDDGNTADGDGCSSACATEATACSTDLSRVGTGDFTIQFTVTTLSQAASIMMMQRALCGANRPGWELRMTATGEVRFLIAGFSITGTQPINDGLPHDVLVSRTAGVVSIAIDGTVVGSVVAPAELLSLPPLSYTPLALCKPVLPALVGSIDDLCMTHECASGAEPVDGVCPLILVDECANGTADCGDNATCTDTVDSYTCACDPGYKGDGDACVDYDECADFPTPCGDNATCTNTPGSYTCACNAGYQPIDGTCQDVDECAAVTADCGANATCTNAPGSYSCACNAGYSGDGVTCADLDECELGTDDCAVDAACTNTAGNFSCACDPGYGGDGVSCADLDECELGTDDCAADATCTNHVGGFSCACNPGYGGDGVTCAPVSVAVGSSFACAVRPSGTVTCWGENSSGQLGDGTTTRSLTPVLVTGLTDVAAVAAGGQYACAVTNGGEVYCWGRNESGQLGDGTTVQRTTPVAVAGLTDAVAVSGNTSSNGLASFTCAVRASGRVMCWGHNGSGQLGNNTTVASSTPVEVIGLTDAVAVSTGSGSSGNFSCALRSTGAVACWGNNALGQLGDGTSTHRLTPVAVNEGPGLDMTGAVAIATSRDAACAVKSTGSVVCWGANNLGQLGNGTGASSLFAVTVPDLSSATALAGSIGNPSAAMCALRSGGDVVCWGQNGQGQLGDGTLINSAVPVAVTGLSDAVRLAAGGAGGSASACALRSTGEVVCWGANSGGQLGDGPLIQSSVPVTVLNLLP